MITIASRIEPTKLWFKEEAGFESTDFLNTISKSLAWHLPTGVDPASAYTAFSPVCLSPEIHVTFPRCNVL